MSFSLADVFRPLAFAAVISGGGACAAPSGAPVPAQVVHIQGAGSATPAGGQAETRYLERPEGRIAYDDRGAGPVVICVPSLGDVRGEYRYLAPALLEAGYRVITMDLRGHGESSADWASYTAVDVGEDVLALARHLNGGPVAVIGTSMAASAGIWAAAEAPDTVRGLVLVGPFVRDHGPLWQARALASLFVWPWGAGLWGTYYNSLYPTSKPADFEAYRSGLVSNLQEPGRLVALRELVASSKAPCEARIPEVKAPVLTLMGTKDPDFDNPAEEARHVAERLRGELKLIEGAGHYPHAEMPEQTAPVITEFLKRVHHGA